MRHNLSISKLISVLILSSTTTVSYAKTDSMPVVVGMALFSVGYTLANHDKEGLIDFAEASFISIASTQFLKHVVDKKRPNGEGDQSFPSGHVSYAATNASYMGFRYGWKWGVGMSVLTAGVAAERFYHDKHDLVDITVGALIGALSGYLATREYSFKHNVFKLTPSYSPEDKAYLLNFNYRFS